MQVRVLGPLEVDGPHGPVVVAGAKQRTLLAVLALAGGRPVPVSELVDALWPDDPPPSARNSLQSHVARLRAALPPETITSGPAGYRLAVPRAAVDALHFCDLLADGEVAQAFELWRGPPLPEFSAEPLGGGAARLTEARRAALADRAGSGDPAELSAEVDRDPCW
ncbi:AfsR/SARP family transcriptional regulator [Couchioplanes caeruleus]|uniref:AfsR/SARP family transcriptional regulator n=1 Tax=Couchioplanes caeruleus TaxID=56438 RepID=UPI000A97A43D|nr:winged helix-turn-helix domain-containing protein [Couchioplanes caeruleus]